MQKEISPELWWSIHIAWQRPECKLNSVSTRNRKSWKIIRLFKTNIRPHCLQQFIRLTYLHMPCIHLSMAISLTFLMHWEKSTWKVHRCLESDMKSMVIVSEVNLAWLEFLSPSHSQAWQRLLLTFLSTSEEFTSRIGGLSFFTHILWSVF